MSKKGSLCLERFYKEYNVGSFGCVNVFRGKCFWENRMGSAPNEGLSLFDFRYIKSLEHPSVIIRSVFFLKIYPYKRHKRFAVNTLVLVIQNIITKTDSHILSSVPYAQIQSGIPIII